MSWTEPVTRVDAPIGPLAPTDGYPSHLAAYGRGGLHSVANIAARDAISADRLEKGMLCYVQHSGLYYTLTNLDPVTWAEFTGTAEVTDISDGGASDDFEDEYTDGVAADDFEDEIDDGSASGESGAAVTSVNGQTGDVSLTAVSVGAAATVHTHAIADVTGLQTALDGKAATSHTHTASQITDATAAGQAVLTAADASAQRTALGLGTAATQASTAFAAASHTHAAADITSGTVATARLGSGTANATTFLRGDQTWAAASGLSNGLAVAIANGNI
jgi:hypothetical protein